MILRKSQAHCYMKKSPVKGKLHFSWLFPSFLPCEELEACRKELKVSTCHWYLLGMSCPLDGFLDSCHRRWLRAGRTLFAQQKACSKQYVSSLLHYQHAIIWNTDLSIFLPLLRTSLFTKLGKWQKSFPKSCGFFFSSNASLIRLEDHWVFECSYLI